MTVHPELGPLHEAAVGNSATAVAAPAPGMLPAGKSRSLFRRGLEVFLEHRLAVVGVCIIVLMALFSFAGPALYHTDQVHVNLSLETQSPSGAHLLGTDQDGYDQLGRMMQGGQITLEVGLAAALLATVVGVLWGAVAGYAGGLVDAVMMRIVDAGLAIPALFLLLVIVTIVPPSKPVIIL